MNVLFPMRISLEKNLGRILSPDRNNFLFVPEYIPLTDDSCSARYMKFCMIKI